jgi:hypothetical protein
VADVPSGLILSHPKKLKKKKKLSHTARDERRLKVFQIGAGKEEEYAEERIS